PFFTTKAREKGTGLGLSTVYGIVQQNHGDIWVHSELGKGTSFKIYIPRVEVSEHVPLGPQILATPPGGSETILLVEDENGLREITLEYLQSKGYKVIAAANATSA